MPLFAHTLLALLLPFVSCRRNEPGADQDIPLSSANGHADGEAFDRLPMMVQELKEAADTGEVQEVWKQSQELKEAASELQEVRESKKAVQQCQDGLNGQNYCSGWCNTESIWGCGVATVDTYTCDCTGCNGCGQALSDGTYTVQQMLNNRYMDAYEGSNDHSVVTRGAQNDDSQKWLIKRVGADLYTVQQKSNNRYMDAHESSHDHSVVTRGAQNDDSQKWLIKSVGEVKSVGEAVEGESCRDPGTAYNDLSKICGAGLDCHDYKHGVALGKCVQALSCGSPPHIESCSASSEFSHKYKCQNVYLPSETGYWATGRTSEGVGSWIQLNFWDERAMNEIIISNRYQEPVKRICLVFSDGSMVYPDALDDSGWPQTLRFAIKSTTSVRVVILEKYDGKSGSFNSIGVGCVG